MRRAPVNAPLPSRSEEAAAARQSISPFAFIGELWDGKYVVLGTAALFVLITTAVILIQYRPLYKATALLEKREAPETQSLGVGALLANVTGAGRYPLYEEFAADLRGVSLDEKIIALHDVLPKIFYTMWNEKDHRWEKPTSVTVRIKDFLAPIFHFNPWHPPDAEDLRDYISTNVIINPTEAVALFEITYENRDRQLANDILDMVIKEIDAQLKQREEQELGNQVALLSEILANTTSQSYRTALVDRAISDEVHRLIIDADTNYSVRIVEPVHTSIRPLSPRWAFIWGASLAAGILAGILALFIRNGMRQYRRADGRLGMRSRTHSSTALRRGDLETEARP